VGGFTRWALQVLEVEDGRIRHVSSFLELDIPLFAQLGLPATPPEPAESPR